METRNFFLLQGRCKSSQSQMSELEKQVPLVPGVLSFAIGDPQRLLMKHCSSNPTKPAVISARSKTLSSKFATSGPPDLAAVYKFCRFMSSQLRRFSPIVYCIEPSIPAFSNSAFLLGSYLVLCHGFSPADAVQSLSRSDLPLVAFRQDAKGQLHGRVTLLDCLNTLERASALGWFSPRSFDVERYERIADPQYGGIAEISPRLLTLRLPLGNVATVTVDNQMQLLRILGATCVAHIVARDGQADAAAAIAAAAGIAGLRYVALRCLANAEMRCQGPETTFADQLISACVDEDRVAVLCPAVFSDGAGPSAALLAAWLAHCDGLPAGAAAAWIRIVCREPIAVSAAINPKHCLHFGVDWRPSLRLGTACNYESRRRRTEVGEAFKLLRDGSHVGDCWNQFTARMAEDAQYHEGVGHCHSVEGGFGALRPLVWREWRGCLTLLQGDPGIVAESLGSVPEQLRWPAARICGPVVSRGPVGFGPPTSRPVSAPGVTTPAAPTARCRRGAIRPGDVDRRASLSSVSPVVLAAMVSGRARVRRRALLLQ